MRLITGMLLSIVSAAAGAWEPESVPANIFGDGNPDNGVEDSREQLLGRSRTGLSLAEQRSNAGTVRCDGEDRGTAMVVATGDLADDLKGVVLVSAAHVFYDLEKKRPFKRCEFHFMALGELPGYRANIDLKNAVMGDYDPARATDGEDFGEGDWAFLYVPKPWRNFNPGEATQLRDFHSLQLESFQQSGGEFRLIAFDSSQGVLSVSRHCSVTQSVREDLGGGAWRGQLLDDCDSTDGASGGGIVAVIDGQQYLVGIRSGSHWSEEVYPGNRYPHGPPDGAVWSRHTNTNFARSIDAYLIIQFKKFINNVESKEKYF